MLKNLFYLFTFLLLTNRALAQAPQGIPYQAVARNSSGNIIANQAISVRFTIRDATATGTILYQETFSPTTNVLGLFNVNVGMGTVVSGTFSGINWGTNAKFMEVEMDPTGGTSYINMGATQMMSVPYALYAGSVNSNSVSQLVRVGFLSTTTWTCPAGVTQITVELWGGSGGGGGSGGINSLNSSDYTGNPIGIWVYSYVGGNGGNGGYNKATLTVTPGVTYSITIGAGGSGGTAGPSVGFGDASGGGNGSAGGTSSFSTLLTAAAGTGGTGSTSPGYVVGVLEHPGSLGVNGTNGSIINYDYPTVNTSAPSFIPSNYLTQFPSSSATGGAGGAVQMGANGGTTDYQDPGLAGSAGASGYCVISYVYNY